MKIFFDFDGTIVDTSKGIINAAVFAFEKFGYKDFSIKDLKSRLIGPPLHHGLKILTMLHDEDIDKLVNYFREYYSKKGVYENSLYNGIIDVLKFLRNKDYSLNIISSKPERFIMKILDQHNIKNFFDNVKGAGEKDKKSTKAEKIKEFINNSNSSEKCFIIGDRADDIYAGKESGIYTIGVLYGYGSYEELQSAGSDYILSEPNDIIKFFQEKYYDNSITCKR